MPSKKKNKGLHMIGCANPRREQFRIHLPNLLEEVCTNLPMNTGMLKVPLRVLQLKLQELVCICNEIDNPKLSLWVFEMGLIEEADPSSMFYEPKLLNKLRKAVKNA